jgi:hypothetical protein
MSVVAMLGAFAAAPAGLDQIDRATRAAATFGGDAEVLAQGLQGAVPGVDGSEDLRVGDGVADTNVHGASFGQGCRMVSAQPHSDTNENHSQHVFRFFLGISAS